MKKHILECLNKNNEIIHYDIDEIDSEYSSNLYDKYQFNIIELDGKTYMLKNDENSFNYDIVFDDWKKELYRVEKTSNIKSSAILLIIPCINIFYNFILPIFLYNNKKNYIKKDLYAMLVFSIVVFALQIINLIFNNMFLHYFIFNLVINALLLYLEMWCSIKDKSLYNNFKVLKLKDLTINNIYHNGSKEYEKILKEKENKKENNKLSNLLNNLDIPKNTYLKVDNANDNILNEIDFKIKEKNSLNIKNNTL